MKKIILLLMTVITLIFSCKKEDLNKTVILSGKIDNPNSDKLNIINANRKIVKTISLNADNTFKDTLRIKEGFYSLGDGNESTIVFFKPSFDLSLTLDTKEFDESITYKGKGANENNYLAKKYLLNESFGKFNDYKYRGALDEKSYIKLIDSLHNVKVSFMKNAEFLGKGFVVKELKSLEFAKLSNYFDYEGLKRYVSKNKDFKVSENFPNAFSNIDLSNSNLLEIPNYKLYVNSYLRGVTDEKVKSSKAKDSDYTLAYILAAKKEVKNDLLKEELLYDFGKRGLSFTKKLDSVYKEIKPELKNKEYLEDITSIYKKLKKIEKGSISPLFELNDINGKLISLNDLKGKLVYIDVWATWCQPCLAEIPSLKKLEEYFKDKEIEFVSICTWDKKNLWEQMVEEKKLGGIQVFESNRNSAFIEGYNIKAIPRFILIDKEGKIIDGNATRPSDPNLQEQIEKYL